MEVNGGGDDSRVYGYPTSRIVRVSRASGGKDRHSKVLTSKGLRDRRVRLSVSTAIQFYDLQDRLGYDQPSKAVEWLIKAAANSINELPSLDPSSFHDSYFNSKEVDNKRNKNAKFEDPNYNNSNNNSSSNSETSKGSGLSLTRCENRIKARERARIRASKKENEKSFTDLLTSGISSTTESPMDYFCLAGDNFNFASSSTSSNSCGLGPGFIRETLQSNLTTSLPHHQIQRFQQSSMVDGSTSTNFPFFVAGASGHVPVTTGYDYRGGRYSDHHKEKSKN